MNRAAFLVIIVCTGLRTLERGGGGGGGGGGSDRGVGEEAAEGRRGRGKGDARDVARRYLRPGRLFTKRSVGSRPCRMIPRQGDGRPAETRPQRFDAPPRVGATRDRVGSSSSEPTGSESCSS